MEGVKPPDLVLVLDQILSQGDSILRELESRIERLAMTSQVLRASYTDRVPEATWLGLEVEKLAEGPLVVAALGADPPERSVHFRLDLASVDHDGVIQISPRDASTQELAEVAKSLDQLNSKRLTVVKGPGWVHGLVWEMGSLDLGTTPLAEAFGKPVHAVCPQGDGEVILRQMIDDSVNLLTNLEVNRRRLGEGKAPINLIWPTGHGFRPSLPNLALRRGSPATILSRSLTLAGLSRLVGYRHQMLEGGVFPTLPDLNSAYPTLVVLDGFNRAHEVGKQDRAVEYLSQAFDKYIFEPRLTPNPARDVLVVAMPWRSEYQSALAWRIASLGVATKKAPFDERALDEPRLAGEALAKLTGESLTPLVSP